MCEGSGNEIAKNAIIYILCACANSNCCFLTAAFWTWEETGKTVEWMSRSVQVKKHKGGGGHEMFT